MNTSKQHESDIDSDFISQRSEYFYRLAGQQYDRHPGAELMQRSYRLLWLGEWLRLKNHWHQQFQTCTPREALEFALIRQHQWTPDTVKQLSEQEMSLALTDYWTEFAADPEWGPRQYDIDKQLDRLDDPFTGMDVWSKKSPIPV